MIIDDALADLGPRPPGPVVRALGRVLPGVREVQAQTGPYAAAWDRANRAALAATGPLWVALGDSMTQGIGASAYDRGWVGQLSDRLHAEGWDHRVVNLSVTGARVDDVVDTQLPALEAIRTKEGPPALVTVVIGSNDVVSPRHRRGLAERFAAMLDRLPDGAVVMNLPNPHREARRVDDLLRARAAAGRVVLADMRREGPRSWRGLLAADTFHLNDRGYAAMADVVEKALRRARA
ncbi:MAG TPA: SGNH/GDSL hydrolase family protein [Lapillicoccus sp.]|nr:SGNH/GDSL hydrolase family protein [Lapillicoccus sp.]